MVPPSAVNTVAWHNEGVNEDGVSEITAIGFITRQALHSAG
jgi:hypothetical protein